MGVGAAREGMKEGRQVGSEHKTDNTCKFREIVHTLRTPLRHPDASTCLASLRSPRPRRPPEDPLLDSQPQPPTEHVGDPKEEETPTAPKQPRPVPEAYSSGCSSERNAQHPDLPPPFHEVSGGQTCFCKSWV